MLVELERSPQRLVEKRKLMEKFDYLKEDVQKITKMTYTRDLRKLMEKVDYLKEDVKKLTKMTEGSHCNETPEDHQMEEHSVGKPTLDQEAQK